MKDDFPLHAFEKNEKRWWQRRTTLEKTLLVVFLLTYVVALGGVIGSIVYGENQDDDYRQCENNIKNPYSNVKLSQDVDYQRSIGDYMMDIVDSSNIQYHLSNITQNYHPAGSDANMQVFDYIVDTWKSFGLDYTETQDYQVLLSYPDYSNPSTITYRNGSTDQTISNGLSVKLGIGEILDEQKDQGAMILWNAYAKNGTATGNIVYVNHCTVDDFNYVTGTLGLSLNQTIVLCRYGEGWRGSKVSEAQKRGAIGVILYSDPEECGPPNGDFDFVFPNSIYMPASGAQRGTLNQLDGDPQTPLYPSVDYTYRWFSEDELRSNADLPNIPVMPIGYGDASKIFQAMGSNGAGLQVDGSSGFNGSLPLQYYVTNKNCQFTLTVNTYTKHTIIRDAFGYIYGKDEPDRQVLISNHVDAWTYGSLDPNSGTAISLEVSRVFMSTMNATGWRPKRTIVFCAWDAEEYGVIGSTEWAEHKLKLLEWRAVALLNIDVGVKGNETLSVSSVPSLYKVLVNASQLVDNPNYLEMNNNRSTVYDSWMHYKGSMSVNNVTYPTIHVPGGGSDYKTYLDYIGIPVFDITYDRADDPDNYPLYHTMYEIDATMSNLVDVNYTVSKAVTQMWAEIARNLADSLIIPFDVSDYGYQMVGYVQQLETYLNSQSDVPQIVQNFDLVMKNLTKAAQSFYDATSKFQSLVDVANSGSPTSLGLVEALNSRMMALERAFIDPRGLPQRPHIRHVVFAPSVFDLYSGVVFSGVTDSLTSYRNTEPGSADQTHWRKVLNIELTDVQYSLESAISLLDLPPTLTM